MLAKRIIVAAFAVFAVALTPMVFSGQKDLFVDLAPTATTLAAN